MKLEILHTKGKKKGMAKISCSSEANLAMFGLICFTVICLLACPSEAQSRQLPQEEVDVLREIARDLGIGSSIWNFDLNPCIGEWNSSASSSDNSSVNCNCELGDGFCHVETIIVKEKDLAGVLPPSMAKLQYLKLIELSRNYLSGTIPKEWESLKLEKLSLLVNRLSGPLPDYLGNMTNLTYLTLENNMFSGTIPATLGNLVNLDTLILSANNLTGELPKELNNLSKLKDLRLSTNNFTGKLPAVLQWENLERLELQASGFEGPLPPSISNLKNLTTLMIGYFKGVTSEFPSLINMKKMTILILNSCNLSGIIPEYIATMENLQILDLSFNSLQGGVPDLKHLENLEFVYLIGNSLSGPFPEWTRNTRDKLNIDLSYNNFSENSVPTNPPGNLNLYRSFERGSHQELAKHLRRCSTDYYSVHINCGGKETRVGKVTFEADEQPSGAAKLLSNKEKWGVSSTGAFQGITGGTKATDYVPNNISILTMNDSELYTTARHSGLSLTYYARCLVNGNYSVTLHFAEIILRNGQSFRSLGQRIFDVYIQDELKVKDFDIEKKAQGVDKETKLPFQNVVVKDRTLEIRLQYAGKGTTAVPFRGSYGPLISAVSVESEFPPPSNNNKRKVIIAVVSAASGMLVILAALYFIWKKYYSRDEISREQELKGLDLQTGFFTYRQIRAATDDFSPANKIGEGGFGAVYKGILLDGTIIAVKQLSPKSKQGNREFVNEIGLISGLQHPNVVRLYGCCIEGNQLLLVYEYMENNSLAHSLFGLNNSEVELDWPTRQRICIGIAKGLAFLHDESALRIVHRDIKATNILLDKELNPKISDFGLAKLDEEENTHISTRVAGTIGYMAPEYALWGYLTYKADVYSFGVVALEIVAGKNNMSHRPSPEYVCLLDWALVLQKKGDLVELVDPKLLISDLNKKEAVRMIKVALLCTNPSPALRPTMSAVVGMLEGSISSEEYSSDPSVYNDGLKFQGLRDKYDELELSVNEAGPKSISSSSTKETKSHDLYPLSLDSQL